MRRCALAAQNVRTVLQPVSPSDSGSGDYTVYGLCHPSRPPAPHPQYRTLLFPETF